MKSKIIDVTTVLPDYKFSQIEIFNLFNKTFKDDEKFKSIFLHSGISYRYSILKNPADYFYQSRRTTKERNDIYLKEAFELCCKAIQKSFDQTGLKPNDIDDLIVVSCTGVNIPGLDILLAKKFGMRSDLQRTCILFMGCYAAFPAIRKSFEYTKTKENSRSMIVCIELCSLHFQYEQTMENVVNSCLFGDGCSVAVVESNNKEENMPSIIDTYVHTEYDTTEHMAFNLTDEGFQMNLSSYVPDILSSNVNPFIDTLLSKNNLKKSDIKYWLIHPGGIKILYYLRDSLDLEPEQIKYSKKVLNDYGNMSSATILFVLKELFAEKICKKGDYAVMMAFGPGLTMESVLLKW